MFHPSIRHSSISIRFEQQARAFDCVRRPVIACSRNQHVLSNSRESETLHSLTALARALNLHCCSRYLERHDLARVDGGRVLFVGFRLDQKLASPSSAILLAGSVSPPPPPTHCYLRVLPVKRLVHRRRSRETLQRKLKRRICAFRPSIFPAVRARATSNTVTGSMVMNNGSNIPTASLPPSCRSDRCEHDARCVETAVLSFDAHHNLPLRRRHPPVLGRSIPETHPRATSSALERATRRQFETDSRASNACARDHRHFAARRRAIERARSGTRESTRHRVRIVSAARARRPTPRAASRTEGSRNVDGESGTVATSSASVAAFLVAFAACAAASGMTLKRAFNHTPYNAREATTLENAVEKKWAGERLLRSSAEERGGVRRLLSGARRRHLRRTRGDGSGFHRGGDRGGKSVRRRAGARANEHGDDVCLGELEIALPPKVEDLLVERPDRNVF